MYLGGVDSDTWILEVSRNSSTGCQSFQHHSELELSKLKVVLVKFPEFEKTLSVESRGQGFVDWSREKASGYLWGFPSAQGSSARAITMPSTAWYSRHLNR